MAARVMLIGPGDLGQRIAMRLAMVPEVGELVLASRGAEEGRASAALLAACGGVRVRFVELDAHSRAAVEQTVRRERPDLILHCAVDLSPWSIGDRSDPFAVALQRAGFAIQLSLQLPLLRNVMESVRSAGSDAVVVNGSYPDLTHPVLAARGLAPAIGIGNAGMIELQVRAALRHLRDASGINETEPVRVAAHHAHVTPMVRASPPDPAETRPRVWLGEEGTRSDALVFAGPPLPRDRRLNELSAAAAIPLLRALLGGPPVRTSAPGPFGLPGGWPVRISERTIQLDLPHGAGRDELTAFQWASARRDGVERVDSEGTVFFSDDARVLLHPCQELAEPLPIDAIDSRNALLRRHLGC